MSIVLLLLYIVLQDSKPQVKLEQVPTRSIEACQAEGQRRIAAQMENPNFIGGLYANCIELPIVEAKK